jgi:hypothetical protein
MPGFIGGFDTTGYKLIQYSGGSMDRRIRAGLANPLPGGVWALHLRGSPPRQSLLDDYGLQFDPSRSCETISGVKAVDIEACPLVATALLRD